MFRRQTTMTIYALLFYLLAAVILVSTAIAVTRRNLVHAAIFLVASFFASALLFYLLGAPLLAMLEIIVYVGAIMVLFLFVIMMLKEKPASNRPAARGRKLWTATLGLIYLLAVILLVFATGPRGQTPLTPAVASPAAFGRYLFQGHWLGIEIASLLLLIALIGVLHLGHTAARRTAAGIEEEK